MITKGTLTADGELGPFRHDGGESGYLIGNESSIDLGGGTLSFKVVNQNGSGTRSVIKTITSIATVDGNRFIFNWPARCDIVVSLSGATSPDIYIEQQK